jgi:hypothetical protein
MGTEREQMLWACFTGVGYSPMLGLFAMCDYDSDGSVSVQECSRLTDLLTSHSKNRCVALLHAMDADGDDEVSLGEWRCATGLGLGVPQALICVLYTAQR